MAEQAKPWWQEVETTWTPETSADWLINSINSYREETGRDPISKQLEEEIRESRRRPLGETTKDGSEE